MLALVRPVVAEMGVEIPTHLAPRDRPTLDLDLDLNLDLDLDLEDRACRSRSSS